MRSVNVIAGGLILGAIAVGYGIYVGVNYLQDKNWKEGCYNKYDIPECHQFRMRKAQLEQDYQKKMKELENARGN